ncbi:MAG: cell shape determination protein CcmA [Candidatus Dadabacteria bacterium]|nr:cell shape determination protein CcmA [Candidatus Dadabacteria bacterium]NIQ14848.1 cell shape determination protein CcmA [Candidatus Dadabacteria bacterium]
MFKKKKRMKKVEMKNKDTSSDQITTLIGEGSEIEGNIFSNTSARIEGVLKGTAKVNQRLIIGEKGQINGDINANHVIIFGKVEGKIEANILEIKNSGNILGDVVIETLLFDQGGLFNGNCAMKKKNEFNENVTKITDKTT